MPASTRRAALTQRLPAFCAPLKTKRRWALSLVAEPRGSRFNGVRATAALELLRLAATIGRTALRRNPLRSFTSKVRPSKRRRADCAGSSGDLLPPSPPTEKTRLPGAGVVRGGGSTLKGKKVCGNIVVRQAKLGQVVGQKLACRRDRCANLVKKSKVWLFHPQRKCCETAALR